MIHICNNAHTYIYNQHIPLGAWYGQDSKSWWFCTTHKKSSDYTLELYRFDGVRWVKASERTTTTKKICEWATTNKLWWTKCHWFKETNKKINLVTKENNNFNYYASLMKCSR